MTYTEVQIKGKNRYYYRAKSFRIRDKVGKKRVYLGKNLSKAELGELEKEVDIELGKPLLKLLKKEEIELLEKIKKEHQKACKKEFNLKYEAFLARFTYDSNAIEGSTLTLNETSAIIFDNITPEGRSPREINEAINHKEAFDFMVSYKGEVNKELICRLQEIVTTNTLRKDIEDQIGKYRECQVYIRGADFIPPKPSEVEKEMRRLINWYKRNKNKLHPVIIAAYFHSAFESIHPFVDGNGRAGRLLMNLMLHKAGFPMIDIPVRVRIRYFKALEVARKGNLREFLKLIIEFMSTKEYTL